MNRSVLASCVLLLISIALTIALVTSRTENAQLRDDIAALNTQLELKTNAIESSNLGMTILGRMISSERYPEIAKKLESVAQASLLAETNDLSSFPADQMEGVSESDFQTHNPFHDPPIQLITIRQRTLSEDRTERILPAEESTSVLLLVKRDSLDVIDAIAHVGTYTLGKTYHGGAPYADNVSVEFGLTFDQPDQSVARYKILPTGFEPTE